MKSVKVYNKSGEQVSHFNDLLNCSIDYLKNPDIEVKVETYNDIKKIINQEGQFCFYDGTNKTIINEMNEYGIWKIVMELDDFENEIVETLVKRNEK